MAGDLSRRIAQQRADLVQAAADKLTNDQSADISAELKRLESHDRLLAAIPRSRGKELGVAALVGAICLIVVSAAWSYRLPTTAITAVVDAESVSMQLAAPWDWPASISLGHGPVRLVDFSAVELPFPEGMRKFTDSPSAVIDGGSRSADRDKGTITLSRLSLGEGGTLLIERNDEGKINFFGHGAKFGGELAVWGKLKIVAETQDDTMIPAASLDLPDADIVSFSLTRSGAIAARLEVPPTGQPMLTNLSVSKLSFAQEIQDQPGGFVFASTVLGGRVTLSDLGIDIPLHPGDRLTLAGVSGLIREIRITDKMTVTFSGTAKEVIVGAENRTPSLIRYVYHNERLIFFWTAVTFVGGTLWSARKFLAL